MGVAYWKRRLDAGGPTGGEGGTEGRSQGHARELRGPSLYGAERRALGRGLTRGGTMVPGPCGAGPRSGVLGGSKL